MVTIIFREVFPVKYLFVLRRAVHGGRSYGTHLPTPVHWKSWVFSLIKLRRAKYLVGYLHDVFIAMVSEESESNARLEVTRENHPAGRDKGTK